MTTGGLTCPAARGTAAPDSPGVPSGCRSRYSAQSPTLGRRTRAANTSATACRSRFSFRLIGAGQPRGVPPVPLRGPQLRASTRPPVRPEAAAARRGEAAAAPAPLLLRGTSAAREPRSRARPSRRRHRGGRSLLSPVSPIPGEPLAPCHPPVDRLLSYLCRVPKPSRSSFWSARARRGPGADRFPLSGRDGAARSSEAPPPAGALRKSGSWRVGRSPVRVGR